jgi:hypothetical protein
VTWAQFQFQLRQTSPQASLDLIEECLLARYEQVLEATDWSGLKRHATIQAQAAYQSGVDTVTLTVGSTGVTGTGTAWTSAISGLKFYRPGDTVIYTAAFLSATALTLDRPYEGNGSAPAGTVYAGEAYVLMQNVYALPADVRSITSILDPVTGLPLNRISKDEMDACVGSRALVADPGCYALYDDSSEAAPPVLHQIEFYPPPLAARGYALEYTGAAYGFADGDVSGSPLPFITTAVLLYGCRADLAAHAANWNGARLYEAKFQEELARLLRVEHGERRKKPVLRMAERFTRHRMARASRGLSNGWGPGQGGPN